MNSGILAPTELSPGAAESYDTHSLKVLRITIAIAVNVGVLLGLRPIGQIDFGRKLLPLLGLILIVIGLVLRWSAIRRTQGASYCLSAFAFRSRTT